MAAETTGAAAGLEFVLYPLTTVSRPTSDAGYLLNFNTGPGLPPVMSFDPGDGPAFWYPIDRAITRQSGASLYGPSASQLFAELPFDELLRVVIASVAAHSDPQEGHLLMAVVAGEQGLGLRRQRLGRARSLNAIRIGRAEEVDIGAVVTLVHRLAQLFGPPSGVEQHWEQIRSHGGRLCWTCVVSVPEEVTRYLHAVTARVLDVFGDRAVGVYTTGSLALGDAARIVI
jgi:hypothetical protein